MSKGQLLRHFNGLDNVLHELHDKGLVQFIVKHDEQNEMVSLAVQLPYKAHQATREPSVYAGFSIDSC